MATKKRDPREDRAPDPATIYERAKPEEEGGLGIKEDKDAVPADSGDHPEREGKKGRAPRQRNSDDKADDRHA